VLIIRLRNQGLSLSPLSLRDSARMPATTRASTSPTAPPMIAPLTAPSPQPCQLTWPSSPSPSIGCSLRIKTLKQGSRVALERHAAGQLPHDAVHAHPRRRQRQPAGPARGVVPQLVREVLLRVVRPHDADEPRRGELRLRREQGDALARQRRLA